jgi:uncharacterized SAM-binding protein YcdF (DUF218 family)
MRAPAPEGPILRATGAAVLALFLAAAFTPLANALHARLLVAPRLERAEAIVVLGAGVSSLGTLSDSSLRRALLGIELQRRGLAPRLVMLGPTTGDVDEAAIRGALARSLGVRDDAIALVTGGRTTREEAARTREALGPAARRILLVTGGLHMTRAKALYERAGFEVLPAPVDDASGGGVSPQSRLALLVRVGTELTARAYHRAAGYL